MLGRLISNNYKSERVRKKNLIEGHRGVNLLFLEIIVF